MSILQRAAGASLFLGCLFGSTLLHAQEQSASGALHGFVREAETGEAVGLSFLIVDGRIRTTADRDGYFSIPRLQGGEHRVRVEALGFAPLDTVLTLSSRPVELRLRRAPVELPGITATVRTGERPFETPEVSVQTVTPAEIRRVPAALEADLFRSLQALPGVVSPGITSGQLLVRGGTGDQNLFLLDGYPVLHPYHLFGAFSAFHVDAVRDAEFWIAAPPARYGGRLSSVLDVALREGNREELTGNAALGVVTSSAGIEGPHPLGAWFVGARATYLDVVTGAVLDEEVPYRFFDVYAKTYLDLTPSDRISGLVFLGRDLAWKPPLGTDQFNWSNQVAGLSWRHLFGGRAVYEQRVSFSRFEELLDELYIGRQSANLLGNHRMALTAASGTLRLELGSRHRTEAGYAAEHRTGEHRVAYYVPGYEEYPELDLLYAERTTSVAATTWALYLQDDWTVTDALRLRLGLRGEMSGEDRSLQPRFSAKYLLSDRVALTAGTAVLRQRLHLVQDPDGTLGDPPANVWLSAEEPDVPVSEAVHLVVGTEGRLPHGLRFRAEAYQKDFEGLITVEPFTPTDRQFAIHRLEVATGQARGIDLSLARDGAGPLQGWIGYSLASSTRTVGDSSFAADPHPRQRLVAVAQVDTDWKWGFTGRVEAFEGIPYTPPATMVGYRPFDFGRGHFVTEYDFPGGQFTDQCLLIGAAFLHGPRNSARTGWSKRLDLGAGRHWTDRRGWKWELSLSVLNVLFDPTGVFRPALERRTRSNFRPGCDAPVPVVKAPEFTLPAVPSLSVRVEF